MTYRIFRHPDVARDLRDIEELIAAYAGPTVALEKLTAIEASVRKLAATPPIGSKRGEICPGLRAIPTARKGVITFVLDDAQRAVYVVSIAWAGADWYRAMATRTTPLPGSVHRNRARTRPARSRSSSLRFSAS